MLSRLLARLIGKSATKPTPAGLLELPRSQHGITIAHAIGVVRRCESINDLARYLDNPNGYVREAAIERAAELGKPALLPALALRLNDWVVPVRDKARHAVSKIFSALDPETDRGVAMQLLLQVQQLQHAKRADHSEWTAGFERSFIQVMGAARIVDAIDGGPPRIAQACFALARKHALADIPLLCRRALAAKGNVTLARNAMELARGLADGERHAIYRQALHAHVGIVRAEALRSMLRNDDADSAVLAESMLVDGNAWVRMVACAYLARAGTDVPRKYAELLSGASLGMRATRACLAGLAESGAKACLDVVRGYTVHAQPRVQEAAFLAWIRLSPEEKDEIAQQVLRSPFRRVRGLAIVFCRKLGAYVPVEAGLAQMRLQGDYDDMLSFVERDYWCKLAVIAELADALRDDADWQRTLSSQLGAWLHSPVGGYTQPTREQCAYLLSETARRALMGLFAESARRQQALASVFRELETLAR